MLILDNIIEGEEQSDFRSFLEELRHQGNPFLLRDQIIAVADLAGAETELTAWYPSWKPNMKSKLLAMLKASYEELFKKSCDVTAIHAGLECGFILEKLPGCDMIAFGPSITGAHSPDERLQISTVQPFYNLLKNMLEKLA